MTGRPSRTTADAEPAPSSGPSPAARGLLARFLTLTALRWLPVGLTIPVFVLLPLDRGLSLAQLGTAAAFQGLLVLALELPTGGLADSLGRRRVLVGSAVLAIAAAALFLAADSFAALVVVFALMGIHRALDSGPLEAWYVDAVHALDPAARLDKGLSAQGVVVGLAIAAGALASGGLVALDPVASVNPLALPVAVALGVQVAGLAAVLLLMHETRRPDGPSLGRALAATPRTIASGVGLLRSSRVLLALVSVELFWGFGMICFEMLLPVRLAEVVGDPDAAAALTGPATSAAWVASAAGAAALPLLGRRLGIAPVAALTRLLQGAAVVAMGLLGGVAGVLVAYLACYAIHGASGAAHMTLVHRQATGDVRATVVSLNSMAMQAAGALGMIGLTAVADLASVSTAMYLGGAVLALAAPLYLPAWRQARRDAAAPAPADPSSVCA